MILEICCHLVVNICKHSSNNYQLSDYVYVLVLEIIKKKKDISSDNSFVLNKICFNNAQIIIKKNMKLQKCSIDQRSS